MPKIRDLGISVIPVTMRPPEIGGGGADVAQYGEPNTARYYAGDRMQCDLTVKDPCERTVKPCQLTVKDPCEHTIRPCQLTVKDPCENTKQPCLPTKPHDPPYCIPTNLCKDTNCPDNSQCEQSSQSASAAALSDDAIAQLKQQLRQQVGTELPN